MANRIYPYLKTAAPGVTDDTSAGYKVGDTWLDTTNDKIYQAIDVTAGAAIWREFFRDASATTTGMAELATNAETITGTDATRAVTPAGLRAILETLPRGGMFNLRVSVAVSANDLIVSLKTYSGGNPSATDPGFIRIGDTTRTVSAATSMTLADGTNWFNAGSSELATKEIDYFAYAVWDSNSSIVAVSVARIPWGNLVSDFSATTTSELHLGNYANFTSTDDVDVIERFAATLSAGAGYTWTVPTFTSINQIRRPIYETRWLDWVPAFTNLTVGNGTTTAKYKINTYTINYFIDFVFGTTSAVGGDVTHTLPFSISSTYAGAAGPPFGDVRLQDTGTAGYRAVAVKSTTTAMLIRSLGASSVFTALSSTSPFVWASTDEIHEVTSYNIQ